MIVIPTTASPKSTLDSWLSKFILEICRQDGKEYPPNTLYCIACGILRKFRNFAPKINFFTQIEFSGFRQTLDSEMKKLTAAGTGTVKQKASSDEEQMWQRGLHGSNNLQTLIDTMIFMCGLYFALQSGKEYRSLHMDQIQLIESCDHPYLVYMENASKNHTGGLRHRKVKPKIVTIQIRKIHHVASSPCKKILEPLSTSKNNQGILFDSFEKPTGAIWYCNVHIGHNTLSKTVSRVCKSADINGFKTNHSLRVTAATRLFQSGRDKQLIMDCIGHHSMDGIRAYKQVTEEQEKEVSSILNKETE